MSLNIKQLKSLIISNQRGILVFDFLFAFMLIMGMTVILLAINFTLSATEGLQYAAFATSRVYFAADVDKGTQTLNANEKYRSLMNLNGYKLFLNNNWFTLPKPDDLHTGDHSEAFDAQAPSLRGNFIGTKLDFTAKVLNINLPILGSTGGDNNFKSSVNSFLGREPTFSECNFVQGQPRLSLIQRLDPRFGSLDLSNYANIGDNGC